MSSIPLNKYFTLQDYFNLPYEGNEAERFELIDGVLMMSPSPSTSHARIMARLRRQLEDYFDNKTCEVFTEHDVQLFEDEDTVYRPDLLVICNQSQITEQQILGPPSFIIEVGSPSTIKNDLNQKKSHYERAGVKEYWVVRNPSLVYTYLLNKEGKYEEVIYRDKQEIPVKSFEDLTISFERLQKML